MMPTPDQIRGGFSKWQPVYAAHGIATFPVEINGSEKKPSVRNYLRIGCRGSRKLAEQFRNAEAFGFALGERSGITVLDVDSPDERVFADAVARHGRSPIIVRSGSGNFQSWYRWNGERRLIRPNPSTPLDILGAGFVVAPPSQGRKSRYKIIEGSLDDLDALPTLLNTDFPLESRDSIAEHRVAWRNMRNGAGRNIELFRQLSREAHVCDDFEQLLDRARTLNDTFGESMNDSQIVATARSVWKMTTEGRNRFGQHGAWFTLKDVQQLVHDPYLLTLLSYLKAHNGPQAIFMVADGLRDTLKWPRRQFAHARRRAIEGSWIYKVAARAPGRAARYAWGAQRQCEGRNRITFIEDHLPISVGIAKGSNI